MTKKRSPSGSSDCSLATDAKDTGCPSRSLAGLRVCLKCNQFPNILYNQICEGWEVGHVC